MRASPYLAVLLSLLSLGSAQIRAETGVVLKPFEARFQATHNRLPLGSLELRFELEADGGYHYTSHTEPGLLVRWLITDQIQEASSGTYVNQRLVPLAYRYRQINGSVKETLVDFDWTTKKVWTVSHGTRWSQDIAPGTQDKLSQQLALRLALAAGAASASYPVADGGRIKTYHYRVVGRDSVALPYGRLDCLKVTRSKDDNPADYTIWIAPELDYLPVKIERKRKSGRDTMELMQLIETG
jgi:hypothetical protein